MTDVAAPPAADDVSARRARVRRRGRTWRWLALGGALGALVATQGATLMRVEGRSMSPTYPPGSVVLVLRPPLHALAYPGRGWRPGDVVVVAPPGGGLSLKRVAAVGPGTVAMARGELLVDGDPVPAPQPGQEGASNVVPTALASGELWLLGDDRRPLASRDSRDYGPLPAAAVRGRVVAAWRPAGDTP